MTLHDQKQLDAMVATLAETLEARPAPKARAPRKAAPATVKAVPVTPRARRECDCTASRATLIRSPDDDIRF